jgi:hypothetical protein
VNLSRKVRLESSLSNCAAIVNGTSGRRGQVDRGSYQHYIDAFNAKDHDGVLSFYAERFELVFAGYVFRTLRPASAARSEERERLREVNDRF